MMPPDASDELQRVAKSTYRYTMDRFAFLVECCYTRDEVAPEDQRIKLIPPKEYIRLMVQDWRTYPKIAFPKSRRMIVTWTYLALDLSEALFSRGSSVFVVSDDLEKSGLLLSRIEFMYEHLPTDKFPIKPTMDVIHGVKGLPVLLTFPSMGSSIKALSQNPDDLRQEGATLIHIEEFSIWKWPELSWQAIVPTTLGGGRIVMVGNARNGTMFERVVKDQLNRPVLHVQQEAA